MSKYFVSAMATAVLISGCATITPVQAPASISGSPLRPDVEQKSDLMFEVLAAEIAGKMGLLNKASYHYARASNIANTAELAERSTRIAWYANDWEKALVSATRWIELSPKSVDARQIAGLLYVETKQPDKAVEQFSWLIDHAGGKSKLMSQLVASLGKVAANESTLRVFDLLRQKYPNSFDAQVAYAKLAMRSRQFQEALASVDQALHIKPDNRAVRVLKNRILLNMGQSDAALESMAELALAYPDGAGIRLDFARMLVQARRYTEALVEFEAVMSLVPDDFSLVYSTGLLQIELRKYAQAKEQLLKLIDSTAHRDAAHFYLGRIEEAQDQWANAMAWYLKVGEGEYYYDAQASTAQMLANLDQIDQARALLQTLRQETTDESIRIRLDLAEGQILRDAGKYAEGVEFYTQALEIFPNNIDLLYARGMIGEAMDRLDILESDMRLILKQEPDNATALNALGYTLADRTDRYSEAYAYIKKALALEPDDPAILDSMGWIHYRLGNYEKALSYLHKAHGRLQDPEISYHLGRVYWAAGKESKALETIQEALKRTPDDDRLKQLLRTLSE